MTAFDYACREGYIEIVKLLAEDERCDCFKADDANITPYYVAVLSKKSTVVQYLNAKLDKYNK